MAMFSYFARSPPERNHLPLTQSDVDDTDELEAAFAGGDDEVPSAAPQYSSRDTSTTPHDSHMSASSSVSVSATNTDPTTGPPPGYDFDSDPFSRPATRSRSRSQSSPYNTAILPSSSDDPQHSHDLHSSGIVPSWVSRYLPFTSRSQRYTPLGSSDGQRRGGERPMATNDGVFANLSAKPESRTRVVGEDGRIEYVGGDDEDVENAKEAPPTYDDAAADSAPPYWETTVIAPSSLSPDDILVDGLPLGNLFGFAWNLLVSMSFQFVGFLLTYVLHTSHAAKNGSRAGLGVTLIQYGIYMQSKPGDNIGYGNDDNLIIGPDSNPGREPPSLMTNATLLASDDMPDEDASRRLGVANVWLSYVLMAMGWAIIVGSVINYWRAIRWAQAVREQSMAAA